MTTSTVAVLATLDTKGPEAAFLAERLRARGVTPLIIDCGILGEPRGVVPDISTGEVARRGGSSLAALRSAGTRGQAVAQLRHLLADLVEGLYAEGAIAGCIGIGGAEGAVMTAAAMFRLPIGVPKLVISPIASGKHEFGPLVGTLDMMVMHSVVDILGLNDISRAVFDNAAAAVAGMVTTAGHPPMRTREGARIAVTMLGNTTTAVMALKAELELAGWEVLVFHSNGVGGQAMEELAVDGYFDGVVDFTTNEVVDPLVGGIHDGGPNRLRTIAELGLPQVIVPGCTDFAVFEPSRIPADMADRPWYDHNPEYRLIRMNAEEMTTIARIFAERLNKASGPLQIVVPTLGLSIPNTPGGVFWDPSTDAVFRSELRLRMRSDIPVHELAYHVNDPAFGQAVAQLFLTMIQEASP